MKEPRPLDSFGQMLQKILDDGPQTTDNQSQQSVVCRLSSVVRRP